MGWVEDSGDSSKIEEIVRRVVGGLIRFFDEVVGVCVMWIKRKIRAV